MINEKPNGYGDGQQPNLTAATNEVVVPNKSRLREEEIEVPYARDSQVMEVRRSSSRADSRSSLGRESQTSSIHDRARTPRDNRLDPMETLSPVTPDDREYYDRMSFSSNVTNKSKQAGQATGRNDEREQKIRAEYEFRIAGLERRTAMAEAERDEARRTEGGERDRRKEWEDEVRGLKEVSGSDSACRRELMVPSGRQHTPPHYGHCNMSWTSHEMRLRLLESIASIHHGLHSRRMADGETCAMGSRTSSGDWRMRNHHAEQEMARET